MSLRALSSRRPVAQLAAVALICVAASWLAPRPAAAAEQKNVKIMLDWIVQGTHAPFFVANEKGYFKAEGVTAAIDPGQGATNVAVSVAGGAYQFGYVDMPSLVAFNAKNPATPLIAVYIAFDKSALAVITLKSKNITKPSDLDGKRIAGSPGTAAYDTMAVLLKSGKAESAKVNWVSASGQMFGALMAKGDVDGLGGFTNSQIPALLDVGFKLEEISAMKYSDFGVDIYGLTLATTKKFADENPETVRAVVKALNHGIVDTIADPAAALTVMKTRDAMMKLDVEKVRLDLALELMNTPNTAQNGLSSAVPARIQQTIDVMTDTYKFPSPPKVADIYTDKFLPPVAERMFVKK